MPRPSQTAKGRTSARQQSATRELGFQDILYTGALSGSESLIPWLYGLNLKLELFRMSLQDETVGSMLWCINTVMAQVDWSHVPQVDGKDAEKDAQAVEAKLFADTLLGDMSHTFPEHVEEALSMVIFGHAPCEIVLKVRDGVQSRYKDKLYGIAKLPLRDQMSVSQWNYAGNDAVSFKQMTYRGSATIPLWKTLLYRTTSRLDRPEGRPLLLNSLRAWRLKEKIQDSEAIGIERDLCGLPTFRIPQEEIDTANETDADGAMTPDAVAAYSRIQNAIKAVRDMRFNKGGGLIMPSDTFASDDEAVKDRTPKWDFKLITTAGQRSIDTRTAARDYDRAIARNLMMQFLHLGDRSSGSYAMSDDQSSIAVRSLMALAMKIAAEFNRKVLPLVWEVNGMDKRYMPRLRASEISKDGIAQIGALMGGLGRVAGLWEGDVDARMAIGKLVNLPLDREAQQAAADSAAAKAKLDSVAPPAPAFGAPRPTFGAKPAAANKADHEDDDEAA